MGVFWSACGGPELETELLYFSMSRLVFLRTHRAG